MSVEQANAAQTSQALQQGQHLQNVPKPQATLYLVGSGAPGKAGKAERIPQGSDFRVASNEPITLEQAKQAFDRFLGVGSADGRGARQSDAAAVAAVVEGSADEPAAQFLELAIHEVGATDLDSLYHALGSAHREQLVEAIKAEGSQELMASFIAQRAATLTSSDAAGAAGTTVRDSASGDTQEAAHVRRLLAAAGSIHTAQAIEHLSRHDALDPVLAGAGQAEIDKIFGDTQMLAALAPATLGAVVAGLDGAHDLAAPAGVVATGAGAMAGEDGLAS